MALWAILDKVDEASAGSWCFHRLPPAMLPLFETPVTIVFPRTGSRLMTLLLAAILTVPVMTGGVGLRGSEATDLRRLMWSSGGLMMAPDGKEISPCGRSETDLVR